MALRDIFKRKKETPPAVTGKSLDKKEKKEVKKKGVKKKKKKVQKRKKVKGINQLILKEPHITEKTTDLAKKNQYVFKVAARTNKVEIKKTIEALYGVNVLSVRIITVPKKKRVLGRISGWRKGYKKALVKVKEGQKIDVLPKG